MLQKENVSEMVNPPQRNLPTPQEFGCFLTLDTPPLPKNTHERTDSPSPGRHAGGPDSADAAVLHDAL